MIEQIITLDIINLYALLFVILIGLPHGAFDGAIAAHLGAGKRDRRAPILGHPDLETELLSLGDFHQAFGWRAVRLLLS